VEYSGRLIVAKVDVDENPVYAQQFGVQGIPTLLLFKNGEVQEQIVGIASKETITKLLDKHL
jgi:thioredoxin 1